MAKLDFIHLTLIVIMGCLLNVSSFISNSNVLRLPTLSAEMSVHKQEERLRFEKKIKFSSKMTSGIAERLLKFCLAMCPGMNQELVLRFTKKLTTNFNKCESTVENDERLYIGYEKAFSNCLFSRYLRAFGFGTIMPEPEINIFTIKYCGKAESVPKGMNVTVYPLNDDEKEEKPIKIPQRVNETKENISLDEDDDVDVYGWENTTTDEFTLGTFDQYSPEIIDLFEEYYEKEHLPVPQYAHDDPHSYNAERKIINRLLSLFTIAVQLYCDKCPAFYKPYATFWDKFISSLRHFLEQNEVNKHSLNFYLYFNGFEDELKKCSAKSASHNIFATSFEIGNIYALQ